MQWVAYGGIIMGNSDIFLKMLAEKHGQNSPFADLYIKNQLAIKESKKFTPRYFIVVAIGLIISFLFGSVGIGISVIGIIVYIIWEDIRYQKKLDEIYKN